MKCLALWTIKKPPVAGCAKGPFSLNERKGRASECSIFTDAAVRAGCAYIMRILIRVYSAFVATESNSLSNELISVREMLPPNISP